MSVLRKRFCIRLIFMSLGLVFLVSLPSQLSAAESCEVALTEDQMFAINLVASSGTRTFRYFRGEVNGKTRIVILGEVTGNSPVDRALLQGFDQNGLEALRSMTWWGRISNILRPDEKLLRMLEKNDAAEKELKKVREENDAVEKELKEMGEENDAAEKKLKKMRERNRRYLEAFESEDLKKILEAMVEQYPGSDLENATQKTDLTAEEMLEQLVNFSPVSKPKKVSKKEGSSGSRREKVSENTKFTYINLEDGREPSVLENISLGALAQLTFSSLVLGVFGLFESNDFQQAVLLGSSAFTLATALAVDQWIRRRFDFKLKDYKFFLLWGSRKARGRVMVQNSIHALQEDPEVSVALNEVLQGSAKGMAHVLQHEYGFVEVDYSEVVSP